MVTELLLDRDYYGNGARKINFFSGFKEMKENCVSFS